MVTTRNGRHESKEVAQSSTKASEEVGASQSRRFAENEPVTITRGIKAEEVTRAIQGAMPTFIQRMNETIQDCFEKERKLIKENATLDNLGRLPEFNGVHDPLAAMLWINEMDNFFNAIKCVDEDRVLYAVAMLRSEAIIWWDIVKDKRGPTKVTWSEFKEMFKEEFRLESMVMELDKEFLTLEQGSRTVEEYASRFLMLGWVLEFRVVPTEDRKINWFVRGLNDSIREFVSIRRCATFQEAVEAAREIEYLKNMEFEERNKELEEINNLKRK